MFTFDLSPTRRIHLRASHLVPADAGLTPHDDHVRKIVRGRHPNVSFAPVFIRPRDPRLVDLAIAWYTSTPLAADDVFADSHLIVGWSIRTAGRTLRDAVLAGLPDLRWEDHAADYSEWLAAWQTPLPRPSP